MSICKRKDGRFLVKYKDNGRWRQKAFRTQSEAEAFNGEMQYDEHDNRRLTVSEAVVLYLSHTKHCQKTERAYARTLERVGDMVATKYVDALDRRDLETVRVTLQKDWGMNVPAINKAVIRLRAAFRWCASEDFIPTAPWDKYHLLPEPPHNHWCGKFEDFQKVYSACCQPLQWAVKTCLALCLRPGEELFNLRWKDIDLKNGRAAVWMFKISMQKIVALPRWWIAEARGHRASASPEDYVCPNSKGGRYSNLASSWARVRQRLKLKNVPLYTVRHMAASLMLERGSDIAAVAAQLGHKDVTTTGKFYLHALDSAQARAAENIPALVRLGAEAKH